MIATNGVITTIAGSDTATRLGDGGPATSAQLSDPEGGAVDGAGNIYIADTLPHPVLGVRVMVVGQEAQVQFAGGAPG